MSTLARRTASRVAWVLWLTAALSLLVVPTAGAYIDPGSGSIVFQALIAGAMGASLALKVYWRRLTSLISRLRGRSTPSDDEEEAEAAEVGSADGADTSGDANTTARVDDEQALEQPQ